MNLSSIQSVKNERIKEVKKLYQKKYRDRTNLYLLESPHLIEEALQAGVAIEQLFLTDASQPWLAAFEEQLAATLVYQVTPEIMKNLLEIPSDRGCLAVVAQPEPKKADFLQAGSYLWLDAVQDPGNVGTMVRTADACGFTGVVLGKGSADLYSPKVVRAMQGSQFHLPIMSGDLADFFAEWHFPVYGTELNAAAKAYGEVTAQASFALLMGNEGQGVAPQWLAQTTQNLYIPITGHAESLNVAVAAGILMYHLKK